MASGAKLGSIKDAYPIHWLVWHNDHKDLSKKLETGEYDIEKRDPRGRTPLMLAVTLGHLESTKSLLNHNANVNVDNGDGFTVLHEAVSTGDPELVKEILERRDLQRYSSRIGGIPELLKKIKDTPDFYVEMKWEFTSWVPLVSRMCPSDTYKVYKSGASVRIDTTLLGFDQSNWQRGSRSYIFKGHEDSAILMEVDHEAGQVYMEQMGLPTQVLPELTAALHPSTEAISTRLTNPIVTTYIDTEKISFERNKSGIWGWRSDRTETVNKYECKVFGATNVELVTKTRTEHLTDNDKNRHKTPRSPLQSFLGIVEVEEKSVAPSVNGEATESHGNPCHITAEEYFNPSVELGGRDIGRPREIATKVQKFKANLWLAETYPLSLQEQILPIVDLMAISSTHFAKLRDFITLQLPSGFPVKIEIPLFHVLNARITFGNVFATDEPVKGVTHIEEKCSVSCVVDDSCFEPPSGYVRLGTDELRQLSIDEDDELLQYAIQQSLVEAGSEEDQVTVWEALRGQPPTSLQSEEEQALQRAIQESMELHQVSDSCILRVADECPSDLAEDSELQLALRLSQEAKEEEERKRRDEEEMLARVLQLSLTEK